MPLPSPNLDDRNFQQLLDEARRRIQQTCPEWTDLSPGDPGLVLLEAFAYLTEVMIYRLNRLPEKAYIEFLRLIGVQLRPPASARVDLRFSLSRPAEKAVEIPRGTRVTIGRAASGTEAPVFTTLENATIAAGKTEVDVLALHCELVDGEDAGFATGLPGHRVVARRPPLIAPSGDALDLIVGVEQDARDVAQRGPSRGWEGKSYRIWREVDSFTDVGPDPYAYVADRTTGTISFGPALDRTRDRPALAAIPAAGSNIRLWYRRGGGPEGNVKENTLTTLKDPIAGVQVTNPHPATGGRAAETLQNALIRGPQELHSPHRAVTAADFERLAVANGVQRAKAVTQKRLWEHAVPGAVEVLLVPNVPADQRPQGVTVDQLVANQTETTRQTIAQVLNERRALGTSCTVNWVRYKNVHVRAKVVVHRGENESLVQSRVLNRLRQTISPLPTDLTPGWAFGDPLRASQMYDILLEEPGVSYVEALKFIVDEVPDRDVRHVVADYFQPRTWYAASGSFVFRSLNDGDGWEVVGRFPDETVESIHVLPGRQEVSQAGVPGLIAVVTSLTGDIGGSRFRVSRDCGETWVPDSGDTAFAVHDAAWLLRDHIPTLLLATDRGLYQWRPGTQPEQILVDPNDPVKGFYAVTVATDLRGGTSVMVAARSQGGIFLSEREGLPSTFESLGLHGQSVRVLGVQYEGARSFLWAGVAADKQQEGAGCFRRELRKGAEWQSYEKTWRGGSCNALAFHGSMVFAGTFRGGVLRLDSSNREASWDTLGFADRTLPLRDQGGFDIVHALALAPASGMLMAGGPQGIYRSTDEGRSYDGCSQREFTDKVSLPESWLFCSGEHEMEVVRSASVR